MGYLNDHPNPHRRNFYVFEGVGHKRVFVIHITAGLEDFAPPDNSAEATARYAATNRDRAVSWHVGSDSDSVIDCLPAGYTAFAAKGYNLIGIHLEISKRNTNWNTADPLWVTRTLEHAADAVVLKLRELAPGQIPVRKISAAEAARGDAGFLGHWEVDSGRRDDPGRHRGADTFPWARFFSLINERLNGNVPQTPTVDLGDLMENTIKKGATGHNVRGVQILMAVVWEDRPTDLSPGADDSEFTDGVFGDQTEAAVLNAQRMLRLPQTGEIDLALVAALGALYARRRFAHFPSPGWAG